MQSSSVLGHGAVPPTRVLISRSLRPLEAHGLSRPRYGAHGSEHEAPTVVSPETSKPTRHGAELASGSPNQQYAANVSSPGAAVGAYARARRRCTMAANGADG